MPGAATESETVTSSKLARTKSESDCSRPQPPWWLYPVSSTCDVCGDDRDQSQIAVRSVAVRGLGERFGTRRTLRYCNDRPRCRE